MTAELRSSACHKAAPGSRPATQGGKVVLFSKDDQHYLQYGLTGMYSKIDQKTYEPFVFEVMGYQGMIGTKGLPLPYTLTVRSGDKACLAMAHIIERKDKTTAATETTAPIKPQDAAKQLQYLTIDRASDTDHPFTPYIKGLKVYGSYTLYNSNLEKVPFFEPSGLAPQTYIFSKAEPGQYIVEFKTGVDDANATYTCQYFFGVYLPGK